MCRSFLCAVHCGRASISLNPHTHTHTHTHLLNTGGLNTLMMKVSTVKYVMNFILVLFICFLDELFYLCKHVTQFPNTSINYLLLMRTYVYQSVIGAAGNCRVKKPLWTHIPSCCPRNSREAALWPVNAVKLCGQSSGTKLHSEKEKIRMLLLFSWFLLKNKHNSDFFKFTLVSCLIRHRHIELTVTCSDDILRFLLIQLLTNRIRVAV